MTFQSQRFIFAGFRNFVNGEEYKILRIFENTVIKKSFENNEERLKPRAGTIIRSLKNGR